mmetsp:Transcript_14716/g.46398  ORF Transcript_14716/g.46398 Transcript_14716/m.46398 type:complete len:242 (-) Transcript_14716:1515-2240(-)
MRERARGQPHGGEVGEPRVERACHHRQLHPARRPRGRRNDGPLLRRGAPPAKRKAEVAVERAGERRALHLSLDGAAAPEVKGAQRTGVEERGTAALEETPLCDRCGPTRNPSCLGAARWSHTAQSCARTLAACCCLGDGDSPRAQRCGGLLLEERAGGAAHESPLRAARLQRVQRADQRHLEKVRRRPPQRLAGGEVTRPRRERSTERRRLEQRTARQLPLLCTPCRARLERAERACRRGV